MFLSVLKLPSEVAAAQKDQNAAAASAASNVSARARPVLPAPAKAEEKVNGGSLPGQKDAALEFSAVVR